MTPQEQEGSYTPSIGKVDEPASPSGPAKTFDYDERLPTPPPSRSASFDAGGERRKQVRKGAALALSFPSGPFSGAALPNANNKKQNDRRRRSRARASSQAWP